MVGMGEIAALVSSVKAAFDITKGLSDITRDAKVKAAVSELQDALMDAQSKAITAHTEQATLLEKVGLLEKEIDRLKAWEAEKQRYRLTKLNSGLLAYTLKEEGAAEPPHELCANCYERGQKSILQTETRNPGRHEVRLCPSCGFEHFSERTGGRGANHRPSGTVRGKAGAWGRP